MRVAVIMGYILSAAFAYCGVVNLVVYILDGGASDFLRFTAGFPLVTWPLAVAFFLYLLIQMAQLQMSRMQEPQAYAPSPVPGGQEYGAPDSYFEGMAPYPQGEQTRQEVYFRMQPPPSFSEEEAPSPEAAASAFPSAEGEAEAASEVASSSAGNAADNLLPQDGEIPGAPANGVGEGNGGMPGTAEKDAAEGEKTEKLSFFRVE